MKKYLSCLLLILSASILFLTGCNESETVKIDLTKDNYDSYISFNVVYEDLYMDEENEYMYCTARITTHAIVENIYFRCCNISMNLLNPTSNVSWHPADTGINRTIKTSLDYNGFSESTICLKASLLLAKNNSLPITNINDITVIAISGQVIVK